MSGTWITGRPLTAPGLLIYITVDSVAATVDAIVATAARSWGDRAVGE